MIRAPRYAVAALLVASAGVTARTAQNRGRDSSWTAPAQQAARPNPLAGRPETAAGGAKVFHSRCAGCHGADGRGTAKGPDLMDPLVQAQTDGALFWKMSGGNSRAGMPAFSFLPAPQRWQLVLHLRERAAVTSGRARGTSEARPARTAALRRGCG